MGAIAEFAVGLGLVVAARPVASLEDVIVTRTRRRITPANPFCDVADEVEHPLLGDACRMRSARVALVETRGFLRGPFGRPKGEPVPLDLAPRLVGVARRGDVGVAVRVPPPVR